MIKMLPFAVVAAVLAGPVSAQQAYAGYQLGPDDSVQVVVYGQSEFNVTTRVKADGTIVMPLIGTVKAQGETNITLARLITDKLVAGGFLKQPLVNVEIGAYVSRTVNVAGNVTSPGIFPLDRPYHVLEILLKAGWVRADGANFVYLRRAGQPEQRLEIEQLVRTSGASTEPALAPGDTLFVPPAETFFIYGQINAPGMKNILPGMTIRQAIALAGGVTASGKADKVGLVRGSGKEIDADPSQKVQNGDVIVIKERLF
ncbi:hypothetical protein CHU93_08680 [Sandarakinorhabdus cyanobacteriorum]|uniref:Soluble ligand binding domain-containing protein n=1 Tax=Sandarakinorhabdus cyanobacteriorum TaxID=1981098 RepID=A0A255YJV6_9SPHN|nr:polysaccharide biosynthesis/export family protein [Sandarakinorhabdus cyanobacteriorum]OYQ28760.1 hypothetical protein CHU93_08680 [Sandarakinorhabdus cyanobacteriorum]